VSLGWCCEEGARSYVYVYYGCACAHLEL